MSFLSNLAAISEDWAVDATDMRHVRESKCQT
jgi:hypothetical protein